MTKTCGTPEGLPVRPTTTPQAIGAIAAVLAEGEAAGLPVDQIVAEARHILTAFQLADAALAARLVRCDRAHAGGTVTYRVLVNGQWIGLVGDGRPWRGWRYGSQKWWACWRQDGDTAARWSTDLDYATRTAAVRALLEQIEEGR